MEKKGRILILDDQAAVAHTTALVITMLGYEATECLCPEEAYSKLMNESWCLFITDYRMPRMNGLELTLLLRQNHCATPIILMTAFAAHIDKAYAREIGISTILSKPFSLAELSQALHTAAHPTLPNSKTNQQLASDLCDEWIDPEIQSPGDQA